MNLNATIIAQMIIFGALVWFTMKFVWPLITDAMNERQKKIAEGLAAAERGQKDLTAAESRVESNRARSARPCWQQIEQQAHVQAEMKSSRRPSGLRSRRARGS